jgi:hypothetical protein
VLVPQTACPQTLGCEFVSRSKLIAPENKRLLLVVAASQSHRLVQRLESWFLELTALQDELIGEFTGRNTEYRVLPARKLETNAQGMGKLFGIGAFLMYGIVALNSGESVMMKGTAVGYPSADGGGITRGTSVQMTQSEKLKHLNKIVCFSEFKKDTTDNWTGKM